MSEYNKAKQPMFAIGMLAAVATLAGVDNAQAQSQSVQGPYIGVMAGSGDHRSSTQRQYGIAFTDAGPLHVNASGPSRKTSADIAGVHAGYAWEGLSLGMDSRLRPALEVEAYYLDTSRRGALFNPSEVVDNHRFYTTLPMRMGTFLVGHTWTLETPILGRFKPYAGIAAGAAVISVNGADSEQMSPAEPGINHFNSDASSASSALATQFKAGVRTPLSDRFYLFAEYRYLRLSGTDYTFGPTLYDNHVPTSAWNVNVSAMKFHLANLGVQYSF